jgi:hypothetical protein
MLDPTYRQALSHAWKLTWHHKIIWIAGMLSIFLGQLGLTNFVGELTGKLFTDNSWWPSSWGVVKLISNEQLFWFTWTMFIIVGAALFIVVTAACAQGALIMMALHWYRSHMVPTLSSAWRAGSRHVGPILLINLLEKLCLSAVLAAVLSTTQLFDNSTAALFWQIVCVSLGVLLALIISSVAIYSLGYVVLDNAPVVEAVARGWRLLSRHLLVSFELAVVLLACNALVLSAISFAAILAFVPSFIVSVTAAATGYAKLLTVAMVVYMFFATLFAILIGAAFNAFTTSAWMYLFMKMHGEGLTSRLSHFAQRLLGKHS